MVLTPAREVQGYRQHRLPHILPAAFSPTALGNQNGFPRSIKNHPTLRLVRHADDPVVQAALSAAEVSYAPYTGNLAGCAVETADGLVVGGRYMESVAYNPSVSPLTAAALQLNLMSLACEPEAVTRVVLVEKPTHICQKGFAEMLMKSWVPDITLEYHETKSEELA
jgi:cytidine deaminase